MPKSNVYQSYGEILKLLNKLYNAKNALHLSLSPSLFLTLTHTHTHTHIHKY